MKNIILFASISLLASGCETFQKPEPEAVKVELRGTPGLQFSGSYTIDGKECYVGGTVPMDIETDGSVFQSEFKKEGDGVLTATLIKNCKQYGEATALSENGGVRARISPGELFDLTSTTGF